MNAKALKIVSEYDQEIPQSQTADNPVAPRGRAAQPQRETPGRQIKQSNQLSLPHQDDCNTRMDIKQRTTKHRTITDSHNVSNNKQKVNKSAYVIEFVLWAQYRQLISMYKQMA